jgi:hypothetical protein
MALAGTWGLWLLWQVSPADVQFPWNVVDGGFPFAAWQLPFALGVIIGYHRERITAALTSRMRTAIVIVGAAIAVVLIAAFQLTLADRAADQPSLLAWLLSSDLVFGKNDLRPGRLLALLGVATFAYALVSVAWLPIRRAFGWILLPLGQRSLGAYGLHLFVVAFSATWIGDMLRIGMENPVEADNTVLQFAGIVLIWAVLPALPWLGRVEHLASIGAPLSHPLFRFLRQRPSVAETA